MMIREKIVDDYVNYVIKSNKDNSPAIKEIYDEATLTAVPIIKPEMEGFLKTILAIHKPKHILEFGAAVGYSASIFLSYDDKCDVVTIEKNKKHFDKANENFEKLGFTSRVRIYNEDILKCESIRDRKYDFIFVDAAKGSYDEYFEIAKDLLMDGGVIVFDNILQEGDLAKSKYAVNRRMRTIHGRMKKFVNKVLSDDDFESTLLSISDGVIISKKKEK